MSFDIAVGILKNEFARAAARKESKVLHIDFMGGEPLANFELIKSVSEYLWYKMDTGKIKYKLYLRTNGTLLSEEMRKWFSENRSKIEVGLSFDGLENIQSINRTEKWIDIDFFTSNWPTTKIKMVVFKDTVQFLSEAVAAMVEKKYEFMFEIGSGFYWDMKSAEMLELELMKLADMFYDNPEYAKSISAFPYDPLDFFPFEQPETYPVCAINADMACYDCDGELYACHMFSPSVLGLEKAVEAKEKYYSENRITIDESCKKCPLVAVCKNCCGMNVKIRNDINSSAARLTTCNAVRVIAQVCSVFWLKHYRYLIENGHQLAFTDMKRAKYALKFIEMNMKNV